MSKKTMPRPRFAVSGDEKIQIAEETLEQSSLSLPAEGARALR